MAERETSANDHFQNEMVGAARQSDTGAKIELPVWRDMRSIAGKI